ncbi:MAG: hypothetical protein JNJ54_23985 [Myxococcaceae bacterium]|nr:hypothetical protein [Myxococcaceae bacterium]
MSARWLLVALGLGFAAGLGCQSVDPNKGTFSCTTPADCGAGYECRSQFAGGGRCFVNGLCKDEELCNGLDDNCDGRVDETFPGMGAACTTTQPGVCAAGTRGCTLGAEVCNATAMPSAERCNGLDDDCNGRTDETFDLTTDSAHCGLCGRACAGGTVCRQSTCVESRCDDGVDNDSNGRADCDDEVCFGVDCDTRVAPASRCGFAPFLPDAGDDGGVADAGLSDGGLVDGGAPDAGLDGGPVDGGYVRGCFRPETVCDDGIDNDGDGVADCGDSDCDNRTCYSGLTCTMRLCPGPG